MEATNQTDHRGRGRSGIRGATFRLLVSAATTAATATVAVAGMLLVLLATSRASAEMVRQGPGGDLTSEHVEEASPFPPGYATTGQFGGHWYALTVDFGNWESAEAEAEAVGGHLASINDAAENAWLTGFIKDSYARFEQTWPLNLAWIGYSHGQSSEWEWVSGDPVTYTNYFQGAPGGGWDEHSGIHAYLHGANHTTGAGTWNHNSEHEGFNRSVRGVIEVVPEPATLSLLAFGGLTFMLRWRRANSRR